MNKTLLSYITDGITVAAICFALSYALADYLLGKNAENLIAATSMTVAATSAFILVSKNKRRKYSVKRADEKAYAALCDDLRLKSETDANKFIESLGIGENSRVKICKFAFKPIEKDDLLSALKSTPSAKFDFFAIEFDSGAKDFAMSVKDKITLYSGKDIFAEAKAQDKLPSETPAFEPKAKKYKALVKNTFKKELAGKIALYGAMMLFMSRLVFYPLWYIICGSAFLIYALAAKFFSNE